MTNLSAKMKKVKRQSFKNRNVKIRVQDHQCLYLTAKVHHMDTLQHMLLYFGINRDDHKSMMG